MRTSAIRKSFTLAALWLLLGLAACSKPPQSFKSTDITGSQIGGDFALPDHNGNLRRSVEFRGKLVVVFFGFTSCPDVCPTTLQTLAGAMKTLGPDSDLVQVIMITADPARDRQKVLAQYVTSFDSRFIGLVPTEEALKQVAGQFKAYVSRNKPGPGGFYSVDHTAAFYVFDRNGRIRLLVPPGVNSEDIAADLRLLMREGT